MKPQIAIALLSMCLLAGSGQNQTDKDRLSIQGTWKVTGAEKMGEADPPKEIQDLELVIQENVIQVRDGGKLQRKFKIKLDASKDPKWMDLTEQGGARNGRTDRAIYLLDGNDLKICIQQFQDEPRPKSFATEKNSGLWLVNMRRFK